MSTPPAFSLRRRAWHPVTIAGCLGTVGVLAGLAAFHQPNLGWLAWGAVGLTAGFATSGSV